MRKLAGLGFVVEVGGEGRHGRWLVPLWPRAMAALALEARTAVVSVAMLRTRMVAGWRLVMRVD